MWTFWVYIVTLGLDSYKGKYMSENLPVLLNEPTKENFPATVDTEIEFLSQARKLLDAGFPDHSLLDIWNAAVHNLRRRVEIYGLELFSSAIKDEANISKSEAAKVVQIFFVNMADAMARGERVEIRGLCSFYVKEYKSYTGRNPKTGEKVTIQPKKLPFFKSGKELKERVDY